MKRPGPFAELCCRHPGIEHFSELRRAVAEGRAPAPESVAAIAAAADWLYADAPARDRLMRFGRALGVFLRPGKGRLGEERSAGEFLKRIGPVGYVVQAERRHMQAGVPHRQAMARAMREIADREGIPSRTLSRWVHDLRTQAEKLLDEEIARSK